MLKQSKPKLCIEDHDLLEELMAPYIQTRQSDNRENLTKMQVRKESSLDSRWDDDFCVGGFKSFGGSPGVAYLWNQKEIGRSF